MQYWHWVLIIYVINISLWAGLLAYFLNEYSSAKGESRTTFLFLIITALFLTLQESYFFISVASNPSQAAVLPAQWFPTVSQYWIVPKILLTAIAISLLILITRSRQAFYKVFRRVSMTQDVFRGLRVGLEGMYQHKATSLILYRAGKEAGATFLRNVASRGFTGRGLLDKMIEVTEDSGWAKNIEVGDYRPGESIVLHVHGGCFECWEVESEEPACDFHTGYWAGIFQAMEPGMVCEAEEVLCIAKGDSECEIHIRYFERALPVDKLGERQI